MSSITRSRIAATGLAAALLVAPAAGARPSPEEATAPAAAVSPIRDASDSLVPAAGGSSGEPARAADATPATVATPVVVRTADDGLDWGSAALGAGGLAAVLLVSGAGITTARRGGLRHGLS